MTAKNIFIKLKAWISTVKPADTPTYQIYFMYVQASTPDDGRKDRPKLVECHSKIK